MPLARDEPVIQLERGLWIVRRKRVDYVKHLIVDAHCEGAEDTRVGDCLEHGSERRLARYAKVCADAERKRNVICVFDVGEA